MKKERGVWLERTITWQDEATYSTSFGGLGFTPDGSRLVTLSGGDRMKLRFWLPQGELPERVLSVPGPISAGASAFAISPDTTTAVAGYKTLHIWNLKTGKVASALRGHTDQVNSFDYSPDGKLIVTASDDRSVRLWDVRTSKMLRSFRYPYSVSGARFLRGGMGLVTCCEAMAPGAAVFGGLQTFDLAGDAVTELRRPDGTRSACWAMSVSPDRRILASMSNDASVDFWDLDRKRHLRKIGDFGHGPAVAAGFTPDNRCALTAHETRVAVLDIRKGQLLATLRGGRFVSLTPDGQWVATLIGINQVLVKPLGPSLR